MANKPERCSTSLIITEIDSDIPSYTNQNGHPQKVQIINDGEGVEKREPFCILCGNVNSYSHYGKRYGESSKN